MCRGEGNTPDKARPPESTRQQGCEAESDFDFAEQSPFCQPWKKGSERQKRLEKKALKAWRRGGEGHATRSLPFSTQKGGEKIEERK